MKKIFLVTILLFQLIIIFAQVKIENKKGQKGWQQEITNQTGKKHHL